jgi:membrane protein
VTVLDRQRERLRRLRARSPAVDHAVRAYQRHGEVLGNQIAAAITYFGFLSLFPLLALAFAVVGYISVWFPDAQPSIERAIDDAFPSVFGSGEGQINVADIASAKTGAGVLGLLGLLYAGLGWVDALRDGLRRVFGTLDKKLSLVHKKLVDVFVLLLLGLALLVSVAVSNLATNATTFALDSVGLDESLLATALLKVLATVLALSVDTVIFAILFSRLPGADLTWRQVRSGALVAAVGFEVLKMLGTFLIGKVTNNPLYATFGVVVGLLVWINFVSRLLVYAAAWTATLPSAVAAAPDYDSVPVGVDGVGSSRRTLTVRGVLVGAAVGAGLAGILTRRGTRD